VEGPVLELLLHGPLLGDQFVVAEGDTGLRREELEAVVLRPGDRRARLDAGPQDDLAVEGVGTRDHHLHPERLLIPSLSW